jgi:hypothetical protein
MQGSSGVRNDRKDSRSPMASQYAESCVWLCIGVMYLTTYISISRRRVSVIEIRGIFTRRSRRRNEISQVADHALSHYAADDRPHRVVHT